MALLLVDLQQGTCGDAQPQPRPGFDGRFRDHSFDYKRWDMGFPPGSRSTTCCATWASAP